MEVGRAVSVADPFRRQAILILAARRAGVEAAALAQGGYLGIDEGVAHPFFGAGL